jgi:hypothetical protein
MTQLPHVLKRIRLNLAHSKRFPVGSDQHGYEFVGDLGRAGDVCRTPFARPTLAAWCKTSEKAMGDA